MNHLEEQIAASIRAGDEASFEALFRAWYPRLVGFAGRYLGRGPEAEEMVQDAFCKLWENRTDFQPTASLGGYLFATVRNRCLNQLKHQQVRLSKQEAIAERLQDRGRGAQPDEDLQAKDLKIRIDDAIAELPGRCREAFELSRYEGKKYQEIAAEMGISVRTVEVQIGKALKLLREALKDVLPAVLFYLLIGGGVS